MQKYYSYKYTSLLKECAYIFNGKKIYATNVYVPVYKQLYATAASVLDDVG